MKNITIKLEPDEVLKLKQIGQQYFSGSSAEWVARKFVSDKLTGY